MLTVGYTASEVIALTGVKGRQLDSWARTKFVVPSVQQGDGRRGGTWRLWGFRDLIALRAARQLREAGISLQALRRVVLFLRAEGLDQPLAQTLLIADGKDVVRVIDAERAFSVLKRPNQARFVLALGGIVGELERAAARVLKNRRQTSRAEVTPKKKRAASG